MVEQGLEKVLAAEARKLSLPLLHFLERSLALCFSKPVKILPLALADPIVGRRNAGTKAVARRERELIAVLGFALEKRTVAIKTRATAISTSQLPIDECSRPAGAA